ncbi:hypothetical protein ABZ438_19225 [Streptomyces sp. NPDC005786]
MPALVAFSRGVPNQGSLAVVNLPVGRTPVGRFVSSAVAARTTLRQ